MYLVGAAGIVTAPLARTGVVDLPTQLTGAGLLILIGGVLSALAAAARRHRRQPDPRPQQSDPRDELR